MLLSFVGCEKDNEGITEPTIPSAEVFSLGSNAVTIKSDLIESKSPIVSVGLCWGTNPNPTIANANVLGSLSDSAMYCRVEGLTPNTIYYAKLYAVNADETWYGDEFSFTTNTTATDIDGNVYNTVKIGNQVWIVENLRTTTYNDGTIIPYFDGESKAAWPVGDFVSWYDFDEIPNKFVYGGLYSWDAVNSGKLCPEGWHVPSDLEWQTLVDYLGGKYVAGGLLKDKSYWSNNYSASNFSGFMARGGGSNDAVPHSFLGKNYRGYWWSSTIDFSVHEDTKVYTYWEVFNETTEIERNGILNSQYNILSVRCIKD